MTKKAQYNHEAGGLAEATGYNEENEYRDLVARSARMGEELATRSVSCPSAAVEVFMDSPIFNDASLDNRDRAMLIYLSAPFINPAFIQGANGGDHFCISTHGFHHEKEDVREIFNLSDIEMGLVAEEVKKVMTLGSPPFRSRSRGVETIERILGDDQLSELQRIIFGVKIAYEDHAAFLTRLMQGPAMDALFRQQHA
jgi:hypothetical protein